MSASKVLGRDEPVETSITNEIGNRDATIVEVDGEYNSLKSYNTGNCCPQGYTVESTTLRSTGDGMGKLIVRCVKYDVGFSFSAVKTTFRIDMMEVTYDLEDHPYLFESRNTILMWLATDQTKRVQVAGNDTTYMYADKDGNLTEIEDERSIMFCDAYMAGIKTFNRYFPVVEKISIWKNPPGMTRNGRSFTGGSPTFSNNIGSFDSPDIILAGYSDKNWFKSKDSWVQNTDTTWKRTEQWTYTPEGSDSDHAWIYTEI